MWFIQTVYNKHKSTDYPFSKLTSKLEFENEFENLADANGAR